MIGVFCFTKNFVYFVSLEIHLLLCLFCITSLLYCICFFVRCILYEKKSIYYFISHILYHHEKCVYYFDEVFLYHDNMLAILPGLFYIIRNLLCYFIWCILCYKKSDWCIWYHVVYPQKYACYTVRCTFCGVKSACCSFKCIC